MSYHLIKKLFFFGLVSVLFFSFSAGAAAWYRLDDDQTYVADFVLKGGQSRELEIKTDAKLKVGFRNDAYYASDNFDQYRALSRAYGSSVIKISLNDFSALTTVTGGALAAEPENGRITVQVSNLTDRDFKIVVFTEK